MTTVALWLLLTAVGSVLLLFLGGVASAAVEIRRERRSTGTVTRPGWQRAKNRPGYEPPKNYTAPGWTNLYIWPLVAVGKPEAASRLLARRARKISCRGVSAEPRHRKISGLRCVCGRFRHGGACFAVVLPDLDGSSR